MQITASIRLHTRVATHTAALVTPLMAGYNKEYIGACLELCSMAVC